MSRVRPALAAVLLVVATAAAGIAAVGGVTAPVQPSDDPVVGVSENSTRVLLVTSAEAAGFEDAQASVTDTLASGHAEFSSTLQLERVAVRLEATDSREAREQILRNATDWAKQRLDSLMNRERAAREAYAAGHIDAETYLLRAGAVQMEASNLYQKLGESTTPGTLSNYAASFTDIQAEINRLRAKLATLHGPVRERVAGVMRGDRESLRVHVTVGNGVMFSTIDGGQYIRESVRNDNADEELGELIGNANDVFDRLYPWLSNHTETSPSYEGRGRYAFYHNAIHEHGRLTSYVDSTTERVYLERQWKTLSQLPVAYESTTAAENTTLLVSRTYAGGPVKVRVENATGAPLDVPVTLNGSDLGQTGEDGELWTLSPAGEYEVSTTRNGETLNVTVVANPTPPQATLDSSTDQTTAA